MRRPPEHTFHRRARNSRGGGGAGACACSTPAHSAQHPASYGGMIHAEAAFCHHLLQIPVAEAVAQVPPNAEDDDLILKVAPTEKFWPESNHWPSPYQITPPPFATEPMQERLAPSLRFIPNGPPARLTLTLRYRTRSSAITAPTPLKPATITTATIAKRKALRRNTSRYSGVGG